MPAIAQTIQVINKSGKVVNTSKSLKGVFDEAKLAYKERKAAIKAERKRQEEHELQKAIDTVSIQDEKERKRTRSKRLPRAGDSGQRNSDGLSRHTERSSAQRSPRPPNDHAPLNLATFNQALYGDQQQHPLAPRSPSYVSPTSPSPDVPNQILRRAQTDQQLPLTSRHNEAQEIGRPLQRSYSATDIDLDLAYGDFHDPDVRPVPKQQQEKDLKTLVERCQGLLVEADCATASAKAIFKHLQDHPDAMAAVALTLAEISNVAARIGPGALTVFKASAPGVVALLAAPEFLIAVGLGVGLTVVMFGGYKIVKRIQARRTASDEQLPMSMGASRGPSGFIKRNGPSGHNEDELMDVKELDRIERWRRGIVDVRELESPQCQQQQAGGDDGRSVVSGYSGTSVEGEFITPYAQQSMGHLPLPPQSESSRRSHRDKDGKKSSRRRRRDDEGDTSSRTGSDASSHSNASRQREKNVIKVKKPSPLRRMFAAGSSMKY